ncbi:MAG TPA: MBL fold metallo-hydrolase [Candidatus Paceibacterota bacterium]|jgi:metallo-beta-lactamase family protein|nr:MBL fold metallo-hydrolase [Candidatus Paceibacterota bacterium]
MALTLTFEGGADTVTGSNFLIEGARGKMLVDCGIEQGRDFSEKEMYAPFPYDVPSLDALVITHAHLDHIGRAPKLMREGFKGKVFVTPPTRDLMDIMLRDSARILSENARDHGLAPMYDDRDIDALMSRITTVEYHQEWEAAPGLSCYLRNTGHILGSGSVRITGEDGTSLALTGDIGGTPNVYLRDAEAIPDADVLVMESVYGDRKNTEKGDRVPELRDALKRAIARGGAILIPAFSLERTQLMLYEISNLFDSGELQKIPVYLDSPLAIKATEVYEKYAATYFRPEAVEELHQEHDLFKFPFLKETASREESMAIWQDHRPKIIMAGAGMSHGGRIGRHEQKYLPDPATTLMIVGYQAPGSPGRLLQDGVKHVRIDRKDVHVRAAVESFHGWSAHADTDGLLEFAHMAQPRAKTIFTALGEPSSARFLAQRIHEYLGVRAIVPEKGQKWEITREGAKRLS